jgi:hypothetical protein
MRNLIYIIFYLISIVIIFIIFSTPVCYCQDNLAPSDLSLNHLVTGLLLWSYKIAILIIGYLFARMGYMLLIKGITGEFKFSAQLKGGKADLVSASPGIFFILMAAAIIAFGLYKGFEIHYLPPEITSEPLISHSEKLNPPMNPFH